MVLEVVCLGSSRRQVFRILGVPAGKENRQAVVQGFKFRCHGRATEFRHDHVENRQGWRFFLTKFQRLFAIAGG